MAQGAKQPSPVLWQTRTRWVLHQSTDAQLQNNRNESLSNAYISHLLRCSEEHWAIRFVVLARHSQSNLANENSLDTASIDSRIGAKQP
jgi:hypothetical protein